MVRTSNQNREEITLNQDQQASEETVNLRETGPNILEQKERVETQEATRPREQLSNQQAQQGARGHDTRALPPQVLYQENANVAGNMHAIRTVQGPDQSARGNRGDEFGAFASRGSYQRNTPRQLPQPVRRAEETPTISRSSNTDQGERLVQAQERINPSTVGGQVGHQVQASRENNGEIPRANIILPREVAARIHQQNINPLRSGNVVTQNDHRQFTGYGRAPIGSRPQVLNPVIQTGQPNQPAGSRAQVQNPVTRTGQYNQRTGSNESIGIGPPGYGNMTHLGTQMRESPYDAGWRNPSLADMLGAGITEYQTNDAGAQQGQNPQVNPQMNITAGNQNTWGTVRQQQRNNTFSYPTPVNGELATAMSQITRNHASTASGIGSYDNNLQQGLDDHIRLALAVQLGANGPQMVKQRALLNVLKSKPARGDIQQILQSRAELYGDSLDPK